MRLIGIAAVLALGALACGEKKADQAQATPAATPAGQPAAAPAAQPTGPVVEVKMVGSGNSYRYDPSNITVPAGGTVRFISVEGGPHNVSFYADSIPAGAAEKLNAAMTNRMDNLSGPFLINVNDHYDVSFAGLPTGTYRGFCLPHQALGMHFVLTVK
jgi:plastocyanin